MTNKQAQKGLKITAKYHDMRLDKVLMEEFPTATFGIVQKLCRKGQIRLDGKRVKGNQRVEKGQEVRIPPMLKQSGIKPELEQKKYHLSTQEKREVENMTLYEDKNIIVLNKPYGLPVQAGSGHSKSVDRMFKAYAEERYEPRLVHRIDKTTTGCLALAKTKDMAKKLADLFKTRKAEKTYWAIVQGKVKELEGVIKSDLNVNENEDGYEKMSTREGEQSNQPTVRSKRHLRAETYFKVLDSAGMYHWLEVSPKTGRKHQIRVHLASIGLPIVGDVKYGGKRLVGNENIPSGKLFLHARSVRLNIQELKEHYFEAPLPPHFKAVFKMMDWKE